MGILAHGLNSLLHAPLFKKSVWHVSIVREADEMKIAQRWGQDS
jgi:hypothetical protein